MRATIDFTARFLPKDRFFRGVAIIAGGTALAQFFAIAATPIITRLFSPNDFGAYAVFASSLGIMGVAASYRYEMAIPLPSEESDAVNLLFASLIFVFLNSLLLCLLVLNFGEIFVRFDSVRSAFPYLWLLPLGFAGLGFYQSLNYWAVRKRSYTIIGRTRITRTLAQVVSQLVLGLFGIGPAGLLFGHIIGEAGGIASLMRMICSRDKESMKIASINEAKRVVWRYRNFPHYMTGASLLNQVGSQIPALLLAWFYGGEVAGWFFLAQKIFGIPIQLIAASVSQVFIGEAALLVKTDVEKLKYLINKIIGRLLLFGSPFCITLAIGGGWLFAFVLGQQWKMSGHFAQVMALYYLLKLSLDSLTILQLLERQDLLLLWNLLRLVLISSAICAATLLRLSPLYAVIMFSGAMSVSYIIKYMIWTAILKERNC